MTTADNALPNPDEHQEGKESPTDGLPSSNTPNGKEQDDSGRIVSTKGDPVPMIPITAIDQDRAIVSIMQNPSVLDTLVQEAPTEVMKFVESADERQFKYRTQKEENRHKERIAREATTRLVVRVVLGTVIVAFCYSAFTKDTSLSTQIITAIIAGFGGVGIKETLQNKKEE